MYIYTLSSQPGQTQWLYSSGFEFLPLGKTRKVQVRAGIFKRIALRAIHFNFVNLPDDININNSDSSNTSFANSLLFASVLVPC